MYIEQVYVVKRSDDFHYSGDEYPYKVFRNELAAAEYAKTLIATGLQGVEVIPCDMHTPAIESESCDLVDVHVETVSDSLRMSSEMTASEYIDSLSMGSRILFDELVKQGCVRIEKGTSRGVPSIRLSIKALATEKVING